MQNRFPSDLGGAEDRPGAGGRPRRARGLGPEPARREHWPPTASAANPEREVTPEDGSGRDWSTVVLWLFVAVMVLLSLLAAHQFWTKVAGSSP